MRGNPPLFFPRGISPVWDGPVKERFLVLGLASLASMKEKQRLLNEYSTKENDGRSKLY
jgi:hypothetical protein